MIITDVLTQNARLYPNDVSLVEVNPEIREKKDFIIKVISNEEERFHVTLADGMKILEESIETNKHNFTRFLVVADSWKADELRERGRSNKATIVFSLPHNEGSLSQVLSIFSFYKINLTKIQSLPIIGREWEYLFYVDVIFSDYLRFRQSLDAVSPLTRELKILGEYAEGESTL